MVGQVAVTLTLLIIPVVWAGLVISIWQIERILKILGLGPEGKRAFRNTETLKIWIAVFLGYVGYSTYIGGLPVDARRIINFALVLALLGQVIYANLTLRRWGAAGVAKGKASSVVIPTERVKVQTAVNIVDELQAEAKGRLQDAAEREEGDG